MNLIYGTTNTGKLEAMRKMLSSVDISIIGIAETGIDIPSVDESGNEPLENAKIKALAYYRVLNQPVFSADSGLYIDGLPQSMQPGVNVRRVNGRRLTDDEMIDYYASLAEKMGGSMTAQYKNAISLVMSESEKYESMGNTLASERFIITSKPHAKRIPGFPLDSLSINIESGEYYFDMPVRKYQHSKGFLRFFVAALEASNSYKKREPAL